eukprot:CAMPEP_0198266982 /NCGR_PEP_ID=MMETSP1447-20131203/31004_1 /TAXON_ID=420782 /ORGANISM="Chaetoceros dichaeta, Strain CCMP1751" /LENGTH=597 /DNA_ID=CAMNT_0043957335 /DNA_START=21 /DNA_END=1814 /DNA_ORIENTATION=-
MNHCNILTFSALFTFGYHYQWLPSGDAFRISDLLRLESETLPTFFRHKRFQSLVRQLNFYNFRKVNRERTFWVYRHPLFHRDKPGELYLLRRRTCPGVDGRKHRPDLDINSLEAGIRSPPKVPLPENIRDELSDGSQANLTGAGLPKRQAYSHLANAPRQKREKKLKVENNIGDKINKHRTTPDNVLNADNVSTEIIMKADSLTYNPDSFIKSSPTSRIQVTSSFLVNDGQERTTIQPSLNSSLDMVHPCVTNDVNLSDDNVQTNSSVDNLESYGKKDRLQRQDAVRSGADNDLFVPEKKSRSERMEQAQLVSKVARQLEAHAKRAAAVAALNCPRKSGRRRAGTVTPPFAFTTATMKYHALTYDDEADIYESGEDSEVISISPKKFLGAAIVTDDDSEDSRSTQSKDDSANKFSAGNLGNSSSHVDNKLLKSYFIPPVKDTNLISEVVRKLHNWVGNNCFASRDDGQLAAAIAGFCMSTAPQDPSLADKALKLLIACGTLAQEFRRYKTALLPKTAFSEIFSTIDTPTEPLHIEQMFHGECDGKDTVRIFKVFLLNRLDDLVRDSDLEKNVRLTRNETDTLHGCVKVWFAGVKASA